MVTNLEKNNHLITSQYFVDVKNLKFSIGLPTFKIFLRIRGVVKISKGCVFSTPFLSISLSVTRDGQSRKAYGGLNVNDLARLEAWPADGFIQGRTPKQECE